MKNTLFIICFLLIGNLKAIAQIDYLYSGETYFNTDELISRKNYDLSGNVKFSKRKVGTCEVVVLFDKNGYLTSQSFRNPNYNINDSTKIEYVCTNDSSILKYILYAKSDNITKKIKEVFLVKNRPTRVFNYSDNDNIFSTFHEDPVLFDSILYHYDTLKGEIVQNIYFIRPTLRQERVVFDMDYNELEHTISQKEKEYSSKLIFREIKNVDSLFEAYWRENIDLEIRNTQVCTDSTIETIYESSSLIVERITKNFKYFNNNRLVKTLSIDNNNYTETRYNSHGDIILIEKYTIENNHKTSMILSRCFNYDNQQRIIKDRQVSINDTILKLYTYLGNKVFISEKANDYCSEMLLDSHNNLHSSYFERIKFTGKNTCCNEYEIKYRFVNAWQKKDTQNVYINFDSLGNWTEVKCIRNGKLENINSQIIEYYR